METRILKALEELDHQEFNKFKWYLRQPGNVAGLQPLTKRALENAGITDIVDQIVQNYPGNEAQLMANLLKEVNRKDLAKRFENTPTEKGATTENPLLAQQMRDLKADFEKLKTASNQQTGYVSRPAVTPGSTNREDFLKHSSPLSWDPNTVQENLILSKNYRKVTFTEQPQPYADHPQRFTYHSSVLSRESLSDPCYFEVEWSGESVDIAVCYKDINRKEVDLSGFGRTDMSWVLWYDGPVGDERYAFSHNSIDTAVSVPAPSTGRRRFGVFVSQREGFLCFYEIHGDRMRLLHTERTSFTRGPLYAGIQAYKATAEVCEIW